MLSNFFRTSTKHKYGVNKKRNVEIDNVVSSRSRGKYVKYVSFPLPPLEAALSVFNFGIFSFENNFFEKKLTTVQETVINDETYAF